jgi:hypothetical protein
VFGDLADALAEAYPSIAPELDGTGAEAAEGGGSGDEATAEAADDADSDADSDADEAASADDEEGAPRA